MSLTDNQIGAKGAPKQLEYGCLSYDAGVRLARKVDAIGVESNPFSVILPAEVSKESRSWDELIEAAHQRRSRKRHADLGQPVVKGFFEELKLNSVEDVLSFCASNEPPLEVKEDNLDPANSDHNRLLQFLDAVPLNSVVVTFSPVVEEA